MITPSNNHREGGKQEYYQRLCTATRCSCDICNLNGARVELDYNNTTMRDGHSQRISKSNNSNDWWKWKRRWGKLKGESDYIDNKKFLRETCSSANSENADDHSKDIDGLCSLCSSSSSPCRVCISQEEEKSSHSLRHQDSSHQSFNHVQTKAIAVSSSEQTSHRRLEYLISNLLKQKTFGVSSSITSVVTLINVLVIITLLLLVPNTGAFPTNNCDWLGR